MRQALELALEALEYTTDLCRFLLKTESSIGPLLKADKAITAIKEALAQPEQEPVAEYVGFTDYAQTEDDAHGFGKVKRLKFIPLNARLYTTPPQRTWVGLTDEEELKLAHDSMGKSRHWLVAQVEAKLKEKNT